MRAVVMVVVGTSLAEFAMNGIKAFSCGKLVNIMV